MAAAEAAAPAAKADRAGYYASKPGKGGARAAEDLVGGVAEGTMAIESVPTEALPDEWKAKDKAELKVEVAKRVEEREKAQKEITELSKQRDEYLKKNMKDGDGFDAKVKTSLEKQLKK
jgi:hypothetical protein